MDSGNSGSMQSSSGGEEEFDSRSESISSFLNSSAHFGSISNPPPTTPQLLSHAPPTTLFNSQNLDAFQQSLANPSGNNVYQFGSRRQNDDQLLWSRGLRSDPGSNYPSFGNVSSVSSSRQTVLNVQAGGLHRSQSAIDANNAANKASSSSGIQPDHQRHQPNPVKNPKKRTRASRRAPTTVLTTDTTNFRQMVQEFTGIPTAPFSAGSPYSRRLDLFSSAGTGLGSNIRSAAAGNLDSLGPFYPVRPSAQKVHQHQLSATPSLLNSSSMIDSLVSSSTNSGLPSQNILNMQNQMLSFQGNNTTTTTNNNSNNSSSSTIPSFLQNPSLKQHHPPSSMLTGKSQGISSSVVPSFDELGLGLHDQNVNVNASTGLFQNSSALSNYSSKFNCSASTTSNFLLHHHDKGLENVTSGGGGGGGGGEGTVGSWICPSD